MTEALTLYTNPQSRGRVVRWMLEEIGQPYETVVLAYGPAGMKSPEYLAINPMGKVPTLRHGASTVTENAAIVAYLAETFPEAGLAPRPAERADYYRWMFFTAGPLESAVSNHAVGWDPAPERQAMFGYGTYDLTLDALEAMLKSRPYAAGDRFTAADVIVGSAVNFYLAFKIIPARPAYVDYAARLTGRPAFQQALAIDEALAKEGAQ